MSDATEQVLLAPELLLVLRAAARIAIELREPFITVRALLLALLDDPQTGPALANAVAREQLHDYRIDRDAIVRMTAARIPEPNMLGEERAAMARFNTLAFKIPDGSRSVWLSREAYSVFHAGAMRIEEGESYMPKDLAYGIAAEAIRGPGLLSALHIEPGTLSDALAKVP